MTKRVLMIAFDYPPRRSSGVQRTLKFSEYLPRFGWEPIVLTARPAAYPERDADDGRAIPPGLVVRRTWALDAARHLAWRGRYWQWTANPDRWPTWRWSAVPAGLALIRRYRPAVIWSTYPIATAHRIALQLQRRSGLPWVADFRDPMPHRYGAGGPCENRLRRIEAAVLQHSSRVVLTTPGAAQVYAQAFPERAADAWAIIENGFDEDSFAGLPATPAVAPVSERPVRLLHSGALYAPGRDPTAFFDALAQLTAAGDIDASALQVTLRASGAERRYAPLLRARGLEEMVRLAPAVPYAEALAEMLQADGLLVFQGRVFNHQIPAKLYEYVRARKPVLALADAGGDTAALIERLGVGRVAPMTDPAAIGAGLRAFVQGIRAGVAPRADAEQIAQCSRLRRTEELARLLDTLLVPGQTVYTGAQS